MTILFGQTFILGGIHRTEARQEKVASVADSCYSKVKYILAKTSFD